jgi:hypothetical protein
MDDGLQMGQAGRGLRYAIAVDDETPQIVDIDTDAENKKGPWEGNVFRGSSINNTNRNLASAGRHTLKIWSVDPGVIFDKIVIDLGGLKPSFLEPPETLAPR